MSVILNALRSRHEPKKTENPQGPNSIEGIAWADKGQAPKMAPPSRRVIAALLGVLAGICIVVGVFWYYMGTHTPKPAPIAAPIPPAAPSNLPLGISPQKMANLLNRAKLKFNDGQYDESLIIYQEALAIDPKNTSVHNNLGLVYLKLKKLDEGEKQFKIALSLDLNCAECLNNLGYLKTLQNNAADAENYLKQAIELDETYPDPYFNLGVLYESNGDTGNAASAFEEYLRHQPDKKSQVYQQVQNHLRALKVR